MAVESMEVVLKDGAYRWKMMVEECRRLENWRKREEARKIDREQWEKDNDDYYIGRA